MKPLSLGTYEKVQAEIARRRELGVFANKSINTTCFTSKVNAEIAVSATGVAVKGNGRIQTRFTMSGFAKLKIARVQENVILKLSLRKCFKRLVPRCLA